MIYARYFMDNNRTQFCILPSIMQRTVGQFVKARLGVLCRATAHILKYEVMCDVGDYLSHLIRN